MRDKKEILQVFDISPVLPVTQNDMFWGLKALTEVLCDIRDVLDNGILADIDSDEVL